MIYEKLCKIQNELKAPKSQYNSFGKYHYRSCEDILEAVKPLLDKHKASLYLSDTIEMVGERTYVKAVATLVDIEDEGKIETSAYAREEEDRKGMDASQITGATSSYARKYVLSALLLCDDTKDADTMDNTKAPTEAKQIVDDYVKAAKETFVEPTIDEMKLQMAKWFEDTFQGKALEEFEKMTGGAIKNPLTIKTEKNVRLAFEKYNEMRKQYAQ